MTFHEVLAAELARRKAKNARYSLRAFARDLRVDHATLSQLMRGVRPATPRLIRALAPALKLDASAIARHCAEAIDFALLGAIRRDDFRTNTRWIAVRLGIAIDEVNIALHRLLYARRVKMTKENEWAIQS